MFDRRPERRRRAIPAAGRPGGHQVTARASASSSAPALRSAPASPSARSARRGPADVRPRCRRRAARPSQRNAINIPPGNENRFVKDEVVLEFAGNFPRPGITATAGAASAEPDRIAELHADQLDHRARPDRQPARGARGAARPRQRERRCAPASRTISTSRRRARAPRSRKPAKPTPAVATAAAIPAGGDPAQYALAKLRIGEAHTLATGDKMLVAVIDSGIDLSHPELAGVIAGSFDALGKAEKPHQHGTAIAGAIAAHARLMGAAPAAQDPRHPRLRRLRRAAPKRPPWRSSRASNTPRCSRRASST